jgi:hypothetical protein
VHNFARIFKFLNVGNIYVSYTSMENINYNNLNVYIIFIPNLLNLLFTVNKTFFTQNEGSIFTHEEWRLMGCYAVWLL